MNKVLCTLLCVDRQSRIKREIAFLAISAGSGLKSQKMPAGFVTIRRRMLERMLPIELVDNRWCSMCSRSAHGEAHTVQGDTRQRDGDLASSLCDTARCQTRNAQWIGSETVD